MIWLKKIFSNFLKNIIYYSIDFFLFKIFFKINFFGIEKIKKFSNHIICCNHSSLLDSFILCKLLWNSKTKYKILAKKELFDNFILKYFLEIFNAIPINRNEINLQTLKFCINYLKLGGNIIIFPEGTRMKEKNFEKIKSGIGFFAYKSNSEIIPIYISPIKNMFRNNINIYIGNIIEIKKLDFIHNIKNKHLLYKKISEYIVKSIYEIKTYYCC